MRCGTMSDVIANAEDLAAYKLWFKKTFREDIDKDRDNKPSPPPKTEAVEGFDAEAALEEFFG